MNHTILFLTEDRVLRSTSWHAGLEAAKRYAYEHLVREAVDRVEVWDDADRIVFRHSDRVIGMVSRNEPGTLP